jgi:hypothetical protein
MPRELPITVAEWPRNSRETLRVRLDRYNGQVIVDCRAWWSDTNGELRPGKCGLTLSVRHLPALAEAVATALSTAQDIGLITDDASQP